MERGGYIYIMTNATRSVLYIGITRSLYWRVLEHKEGIGCDFTAKYKCKYLLYYEVFTRIEEAIQREKVLKRWKREWKENLIKKMIPEFNDITELVKEYI